MAIKPISQIDPFKNKDTADDNVTSLGGALTMMTGNASSVSDGDKSSSEPTDAPDFLKRANSSNSDKYEIRSNDNSVYTSLFEISRPVDAGDAGINSSKFNSYKITYRDLAKNLILDTKAYLNRRNNLGEFNLCALTFANYTYKGHKKFLAGFDANDASIKDELKNDGNDYSGSGVDIEGKLSVTDDCTFCKDVSVGNDLCVWRNLSVNGKLDVDGALSAKNAYFDGSLTVNQNISIGNDLTVKHDISVGNDLCVWRNLSVRNELDVDGALSAKDAYFDGSISVKNNISAVSAYFNYLSVGNIAILTAMHALWSDLAEYYLADEKYESGTLVQFGGNNEVTIARNEVNAVVTTNPAFLMNCAMREKPLGCAVALAGRVPVKATGKVKKFDKLVLSDVPGVARARKKFEFWKKIIGIALEENSALDIKNIECAVKLNL